MSRPGDPNTSSTSSNTSKVSEASKASAASAASKASTDSTARERGAATVIWLSVISVVVMFGLLAVAVGELASGRAKASAAADLGALAGAGRVITGDQCAAARRVVSANGARLTRCVASLSDVEVEVSVRPTGLLARLARRAGDSAPQIRMSARAGQPRN